MPHRPTSTDFSWLTWDWLAWRAEVLRTRRAQRRLTYRRDHLGHDVAFALATIERRLQQLGVSEP